MQGVLILILKLGGGGCILKILINNNYYKVVLKLIKEKIVCQILVLGWGWVGVI